MAQLARWTGGSATLPTESWASPNGLFTTQQRNDASLYSYASATARLTLPATIPADVNGYLVIARVHMTASHNNRHTQQGRFTLNAGTGNLVSATTGGYSRNTNNNENFITTWAVYNNPSNGASIDYEWKRDTGDGTVAAVVTDASLEVIPLSYADIGMYTSDDLSTLAGTTPNILPLSSTVLEGTNITRTGNVITVTGDNKRYLVLGSNYTEGRSGRTQRWIGGYYDGALDRGAMACLYHRDVGTDELGGHFTDIIETATASRTISQAVYLGDGVANNQGGSEAAGVAPAVGQHTMVVIELNDSAEVMRSSNASAASQVISGTTPVDMSAVNVVDFNDAASFTKVSATAINAEQAMDCLAGANVGGAYNNVASGVRYEGRAEITVNGTEDGDVKHGNYGRGLQSTTDTFGYSSNPVGFVALAANDDVGVSNTRNGADAGPVTAQAAWTGLWLINLDTLAAAGGEISELPTSALTVTANAPTTVTTEHHDSILATATLTVTSNAPTVVATEHQYVSMATTTLTLVSAAPQSTSTENIGSVLSAADITLTGNAPSVEATEHHRAQPPEAALTLTANAPTAVAEENHFSVLPTASLAVTANTPTVTTTDIQFVVLPAAVLAVVANVPTIITTSDSEATQEGYRWRNDDGTEITASWINPQDTPTTRNKLTNTRLRVVIDFTGDPSALPFTLQYKKTTEPASAWRDVEDL